MTSEILYKDLKTPGNSWVSKQYYYFVVRASIEPFYIRTFCG